MIICNGYSQLCLCYRGVWVACFFIFELLESFKKTWSKSSRVFWGIWLFYNKNKIKIKYSTVLIIFYFLFFLFISNCNLNKKSLRFGIMFCHSGIVLLIACVFELQLKNVDEISNLMKTFIIRFSTALRSWTFEVNLWLEYFSRYKWL